MFFFLLFRDDEWKMFSSYLCVSEMCKKTLTFNFIYEQKYETLTHRDTQTQVICCFSVLLCFITFLPFSLNIHFLFFFLRLYLISFNSLYFSLAYNFPLLDATCSLNWMFPENWAFSCLSLFKFLISVLFIDTND